MSSLIMYYFLFLCIAGFVVLSILSMMAFANLPCMNIKQGKNVNSGITLIITAIVKYLFNLDLCGDWGEFIHQNKEIGKNRKGRC